MDNKKINQRFDELESLISDLKISLADRCKELELKMNEVINSQSFLNDKYEQISTRMDAAEQDKSALVAENISLRTQVMKSTNDIALLQQEVNDLEQYGRRDCLEIRGIPAQEKETVEGLNEIVQRIGEEIGIQIQDHDISTSHRLSSSRKNTMADPRVCGPNPIIVKISNRKVREDF